MKGPPSPLPPPAPPPPTMQQQQPATQQQQLLLSGQPAKYGTTQSQPGVRRIFYRHWVFNLGLCGLALSLVLYTVAFAVPAWAGKSGLWVACFKVCGSNVGHGPDWMDATRGMAALALVGFILSWAVELHQDVIRRPPLPDNKLVEVLGFCAGVFGIIGVSIFGAHMDNRTTFKELLGSRHQELRSWLRYNEPEAYLDWGFWLAVVACTLGIVSSLLVCVSRVEHAGHTLQALANLGVYPAASNAPPAVLIQPVMTTAPVAPGSGPGMPAVHAPVCFVLVQGRMVPVYQEMPAPSLSATSISTTTTTATPVMGSEPTVKWSTRSQAVNDWLD